MNLRVAIFALVCLAQLAVPASLILRAVAASVGIQTKPARGRSSK